ncbi:GNAT family N-acetyltransferase [Clostridium sp. D2Q-14]|uniref:GNAT family N-acetyltransferase n=1 Tax=Anaeromonas gelatinilytica TaxID=2683194 RepID=UPI00193C159A|nr:GNAT family N-acetyltransferase [Anaeromonas gelatinilytica]
METKKKDLDRIIEIERNKENSKYVFSWSKERHLEAINSSSEIHITIKLKEDDLIVGYVLLNNIGGADESIEFRRIAIDKKGKGYGRESIKLIKKLAFEKEKCHRLWLDVYDDNHRGLALYLSEGFNIEGVLRESKKGKNGYRSLIVLSILEHEYKM